MNSGPARALVAATCAAALVVGAIGCGSDGPTQPASGPPPGGTGSGTLLVQADVSGSDIAPGVFQTDFLVTVADTANRPVSGASVQVSLPSGMPVTLAEDPLSLGTYRASRAGFVAGTHTLSVTRGLDRVSGVRATAPMVHTITAPAANDTVSANQAVPVSWMRPTMAQEVSVESRDYVSPAPEADAGTSLVPAGGNPVRGDQRFRVHRLNRTLISGGRPGSRFEARFRNSVEPVIAR